MENSRKIRNIVGMIILVVLILGVISYLFMSIFKGNLSKSDVQTILDKRSTLSSVHTRVYMFPETFVNENSPTAYIEFFMHDNFAQVAYVLQNGQKIIYQEDKTTGDVILINELLKNILLKIENLSPFSFRTLKDLSDISKYKKFKYLGSTMINERETIIVFLQENKDSAKELVYIDKETGIVVKYCCDYGDLYVEELTQIEPLNDVNFMIDIEKTYPEYKVFEITKK